MEEAVSVCDIWPDTDADEDNEEILVAETVTVGVRVELTDVSGETLPASDKVAVPEI